MPIPTSRKTPEIGPLPLFLVFAAGSDDTHTGFVRFFGFTLLVRDFLLCLMSRPPCRICRLLFSPLCLHLMECSRVRHLRVVYTIILSIEEDAIVYPFLSRSKCKIRPRHPSRSDREHSMSVFISTVGFQFFSIRNLVVHHSRSSSEPRPQLTVPDSRTLPCPPSSAQSLATFRPLPCRPS